MPYWFDGNNLIGQSAAIARVHPETSSAFLKSLSNYRRSKGANFLVYFDGDDPGRFPLPHGIAVRFCAPFSADETILRRLKEIRFPSEVIVVTNDRELRRRCLEAGAAVLNWQQFVSKMKSRPDRCNSVNKPEGKIDIEDWLRYFGQNNVDSKKSGRTRG